jgi:hypothetical protein
VTALLRLTCRTVNAYRKEASRRTTRSFRQHEGSPTPAFKLRTFGAEISKADDEVPSLRR